MDNPELITGENSAEALLERIKSERQTAKVKKTRKGKVKKDSIQKNNQDTTKITCNVKLSPVELVIAEGKGYQPQEIFDQLAPSLNITEVFNEISTLLEDNKIEEKTVDGITGFFIKQ